MPTIRALGIMSPSSDFPGEWWVSAPIPVSLFLGATLEFVITDIVPEQDGFAADVEAAVQAFLSLNAKDRFAQSHAVFQNYRDFLDATDIDPLPISDAQDIWNFVRPTTVYVSRRHRRDADVYIQVACECDWEEEHGLQLTYRRGLSLSRVSEQDGHLTEADAYDLPEPGYA